MRDPSERRTKRIPPVFPRPGHRIVAKGRASDVHAELAEMGYKYRELRKKFKLERKIHIANLAINALLCLWLLSVYM